MDKVLKVKKKKEFSGLPDSVVERALGLNGGDVKEARSFLRKYFGVFLTNKVLKGKDLLSSHFSSRKRDYGEFYESIFLDEVFPYKTKGSSILASLLVSHGKTNGIKGKVSILDLGCGVNGFSYGELEKVVGDLRYVGVEAAGQLVDFMNSYFEENGFSQKRDDSGEPDGKAICGDLMDLGFVEGILDSEKFDVVFLFQVVDALESVEKDYSKKLIELVMEKVGMLVISLPVVSLGGRKRIGEEKRKWLVDWLEERFDILKDFEMFGERIICVKVD